MNSVQWARILFFLDNCNIGGLRFLGERCGVWGRVLWAVVLTVSVIGMTKIFILTYERFFTDIVSIGINSDYLHWTNTFLAVSVCLRRGTNINLFAPKFEEKYQNDFDYKKSIYDITFFNAEDNNRVALSRCKGLNATCNVDLEAIWREWVPHNCNDIMLGVYYNGKKFGNCEDIFKFHFTLSGPCFIANALIDYDLDTNKLPLKFDREFSNPVFSFETKKDVYFEYRLYVHSPEDFPNNRVFEHNYKDSRRFRFAINEMENDPDVMNSSTVEERRCRFLEEKMSADSIYHYSFTTCLQNLQIQIELDICNCTLRLAPEKYKDFYCKFQNYSCIKRANTKYFDQSIDKLCIKSCIQIEYWIVSLDEVLDENNALPYFVQEIVITNEPTMRYTRSVARTSLDLVVAIGGVAGLFFGASIMNIFEILYLFLLRQF